MFTVVTGLISRDFVGLVIIVNFRDETKFEESQGVSKLEFKMRRSIGQACLADRGIAAAFMWVW